MATLKEQNDLLICLRQKLAIWEAIYSITDDKFISKDGRRVSGIKVPGLEELVQEELIEEVLQSIGDGPIQELKDEIDSIENQQVIVLDKSKANI